jgi:hypothetical protein
MFELAAVTVGKPSRIEIELDKASTGESADNRCSFSLEKRDEPGQG